MKILEFILSDFSSLQKELLKKFNFVETSYNYLQAQSNKKNSFFKRVFLESGLEVWILSAQFEDDILLKQNQSNNLFNAIHFLDFNGQFYQFDASKEAESIKGIYITNSKTNLNFKIKAFENINMVSFIYSKRWLDINLSNTNHYNVLFDDTYALKKYVLNDIFKNTLIKLLTIEINSQGYSFLLKINILTLLSNFLDLVDNEHIISKLNNLTIKNYLPKIEEILSTNFEVQLSKIYEEITHNGFDKNEFIEQFKIKNEVGLFEFRQVKKLEYALKLLKEGYRVKDVSKETGFKSESRFIEYFKKGYGDTPSKYIKNIEIKIPSS